MLIEGEPADRLCIQAALHSTVSLVADLGQARRSQHSQWIHLPNEVWGEIFVILYEEYVDQYDPHQMVLGEQGFEDHSWFFQLQLVCTKFQQVVAQQPNFYHKLFLHKNLDSRRWHALVRWIRRHKAAIQNVVACCGSPWLEATLAALYEQDSCLTHLDIFKKATATSLEFMAVFPALKQCTLEVPAAALQPMKALPHLQSLNLRNGVYSGLESARFLTSLSVRDAQVECAQDCLCFMSLVVLELRFSVLIGWHSNTIAACSCLQSLHYLHSSIAVSRQDNIIRDVQVAASISSLIHLTELTLSICDTGAHVDLDWLSQLKSLEELFLNVHVKQAVFSTTFVTLSNLTEMTLVGGLFHFKFDWKSIPALKHLWCNGIVGFTPSLLGILAVKSLRQFRFTDEDNVDSKAAPVIKDLVDRLQRDRPDVELYVGYPALGYAPAGWL